MKVCNACKLPKPDEEFPVMAGRRVPRCRPCVNAGARASYHRRMQYQPIRLWKRFQSNLRYAKKRERVA